MTCLLFKPWQLCLTGIHIWSKWNLGSTWLCYRDLSGLWWCALFFFHRLEGLEYEVLQWCICRLEAWFATDMDNISLKNWDQVCNAELPDTHMPIQDMLYSLQNQFKDEFICQIILQISEHTLAWKACWALQICRNMCLPVDMVWWLMAMILSSKLSLKVLIFTSTTGVQKNHACNPSVVKLNPK